MGDGLMEYYHKVTVRTLSHISLCCLKHTSSCFIASSLSDISSMNKWGYSNTACSINLTGDVELLSNYHEMIYL